MIMDSSEEEEEEETSVQEPIDWAAEAAKTAARSLAKSASQSYVTSLVPRCAEAAKDPSIQEKQQKALDALVARHPEMAQKKAAPPAPAAPAASPAPAVAAAPAVAPATAPASPKKGASFKETSPAPAPAPATPSPKRAEPKASPKASPKARPKAPPSPARAPPKKVRARKAVEASRADGEAQLEADETMASTVNTAVSLSYDKAATQMDMTMTPKRRSPKAMSASMTQLPSTRGPIETSGCQREMFLHSLSKHGSMPLLSFVPRRDTNLWGSNSNPAPGTYPTMDESRTSKYMAPRQVSFGFTKRGGRGDGRGAEPGPGAHSITNFERFRFAEPVRHSFGGAPRGRPNPIRSSGPGPGAYGIQKSADEEGPAVTMVGKHRKRGVLNHGDPGPGAYDPSTVLCDASVPSIGFATALRKDFYPKEEQIPAPGTYEVHGADPLASDNLGFSLVGKRRRHDLTAHLYAGPGPGFYSHGSSFGYQTTWHVPK